MNLSRSKTYKVPYESVYYKRVAESTNDGSQSVDRVKIDKMKQFADHVKENFIPSIDEEKRSYF